MLCVLNHDESRGVLARSRYGKGSLELSIDETGLKYRCELPNTALGDEVLEGLKRGDIQESSFCFTIAKDRVETVDGQTIRHIEKVDMLYDCSPVYFPAYPDTSVSQRSIDSVLACYHENLEKQINNI